MQVIISHIQINFKYIYTQELASCEAQSNIRKILYQDKNRDEGRMQQLDI